MAVLLYLLQYPLIHQFDSTPSVARTLRSCLVILPISYGAWGIIMMTSAIFNAWGTHCDQRYCLLQGCS